MKQGVFFEFWTKFEMTENREIFNIFVLNILEGIGIYRSITNVLRLKGFGWLFHRKKLCENWNYSSFNRTS